MSDASGTGSPPPPGNGLWEGRVVVRSPAVRHLGVALVGLLVVLGAIWWAAGRDSGAGSGSCSNGGRIEFGGRTYQAWPTDRLPERGQQIGTGTRLPCAGHRGGDSLTRGVDTPVYELPRVPIEVAVLVGSIDGSVVYLNIERADRDPPLPPRASGLQQPLACRVTGDAVVTGMLTEIEGRPVAPTATATAGRSPSATGTTEAAPPGAAHSAPRGSAGPSTLQLPTPPYDITVEVAGAGLGAPEYIRLELPVHITAATRGGQDAALLSAALPRPGARDPGQHRLAVTVHCVGDDHYADRLALV